MDCRVSLLSKKMTEPQEANLRQYIDRLFQLRQEMNQTLTEQELEAIALDTGMTLEDWQALKQKAKNCLTRASGYIQYQRWDDAIAELEQAREITPLGLETLYQLASAYERRYSQHRKVGDRQQGEMYAKQCLQVQPDYQPALELLGNLHHAASSRGKGAILWGSIGSIALLGLVAGLFLFPSRQQEAIEPQNSNPSVSVSDTSEQAIPVTFDYPPELEGLQLEIPVSRLQVYEYSDSAYYKIQGRAINNSDREIERLEVNLALLDRRGKTVYQLSRGMVTTFDPPVRPGDRHVFNLTPEIDPNQSSQIKEARLTVQSSETIPAASNYDPARPVEVAWAIDRPGELQIAVGERSAQTRDRGNSLTHEAIFEVTNMGRAAIKHLRLQVNFYDRTDGELLDRQETYLVTDSELPLLQGETRLFDTLRTGLDPSFTHYEIKAIEVE